MTKSRSPAVSGWLGAWRGWRLGRSASAEARAYRSGRVSTIRAALAAAEAGGFTFLAGDSHAELLGTPDLAGRASVNGGIGGATAPVYAAELDGLAFPARAGVAVLFIGSNDIAEVHAPLSNRGIGRFERGVSQILAGLQPRAEEVWIAALPPIVRNAAYPQVVEAVPRYNAILAAIARSHDCPFLDPFASLRDGEGGRALAGAMRDGTHLADYRPVAAYLGTRLAGPAVPIDLPMSQEAEDPACAPRPQRL